MEKGIKIVIAITSPISTVLIKGQLAYLRQKGYDVILLAPEDSRVKNLADTEGIRHIAVNFRRGISPIIDLFQLVQLIKILRKEQPDIVNAGTPKASLLVLLASKILNIKIRIYTCRGLIFESEKGVGRSFLKAVESFTGSLSSNIVCVGHSLKATAVAEGVFPELKCKVFAKGSSNGLDIEYFSGYETSKEGDRYTYGFVGRAIARKGFNELIRSFLRLRNNFPDITILIVGGLDEGQLPDEDVLGTLDAEHGITMTGWVDDIRPYLSKTEIMVHPAYWEGFCNVLIQGAAMGKAIITTDGTGCYDAVVDEYNSLVIPARNPDALYEAMKTLYLDHSLKEKFEINSPTWAKNFANEVIWCEMDEFYQSLITPEKRAVVST